MEVTMNEIDLTTLPEVLHQCIFTVDDLIYLLEGGGINFLSQFFYYTRHYENCLEFVEKCRDAFSSNSVNISRTCDEHLVSLKLLAYWQLPDYPKYVEYFEYVLKHVNYLTPSIKPPEEWDSMYFQYFDGNYYYYHFLCTHDSNYKRAKSGNGPKRRRKPLTEDEYQKRLHYLKRVLPIYLHRN
jgi:hypothetical protein